MSSLPWLRCREGFRSCEDVAVEVDADFDSCCSETVASLNARLEEQKQRFRTAYSVLEAELLRTQIEEAVLGNVRKAIHVINEQVSPCVAYVGLTGTLA